MERVQVKLFPSLERPVRRVSVARSCKAYLYPAASGLPEPCDAMIRIPGESTGAEQDVSVERQRNLSVSYKLEEVSTIQQEGGRGAF